MALCLFRPAVYGGFAGSAILPVLFSFRPPRRGRRNENNDRRPVRNRDPP